MSISKTKIFLCTALCLISQGLFSVQYEENEPQNRGLFYSISNDAYRLEVVSYENYQLTLSDGSVWHVNASENFNLSQGEEVTFEYRTLKAFGHIRLYCSSWMVYAASFIETLNPDYKAITSIEGNKMTLSDGSQWSIPRISVTSLLNIKQWNVGDRIFASRNYGSLVDNYLLINLEIVNASESDATATAFYEGNQ